MIFTETDLKGSYIIEPEKVEDDRGFFTRSWDKRLFEQNGLNTNLVQCNISFNKVKGIIRGLHYQTVPYEEVKLIRCTSGRIFDVIVDLRINSTTFKKWIGLDLNSKNHKMVYVPEGFAHGFQTMEDETEVFYQMSQFYNLDFAKGIRWNDKEINIKWPLKEIIISDRDKSFPDFQVGSKK